MKQFFHKIHYPENKDLKIFETLLGIFSVFYYLGNISRKLLYKTGILKKEKLPATVISIGNLTTGGTGKTPLTAEIADYIKRRYNKKVAILSRGYGGQLSTKGVNIISDGKNIYSPADLAGDEPYWMASNLDDIMVLTGKDRVKTGTYAIENLGAEVLILDDGFQHIKLERDLNILVIDASKKFGNGRLLPAGPLREPLSEIKRADKVVVMDKNILSEKFCCTDFFESSNKPLFECRFKNAGIFKIKSNEEINPNRNNIYAFAGIAQPEFFFNNLKSNNFNLVYTRTFADHHLYTKEDLVNIIREAASLNADGIVTTEKDAVKLLGFIDKIDMKIPVYAQKIKLDVDLENLISIE